MTPLLRVLDIAFSLVGIIALFPVFLAIFLIGLLDTGAPLFRQIRVGRGQKPFVLNKFRTMKLGTNSVATHKVDRIAITRFGRFLRVTKLDELPQLWNVLRGDMSLVGPRPCLPDQTDLIVEREALGVFDARPGITGLAQIKGIDMSTPVLLASTDRDMLATLDSLQYLKLIALTASGKGAGDRVIN